MKFEITCLREMCTLIFHPLFHHGITRRRRNCGISSIVTWMLRRISNTYHFKKISIRQSLHSKHCVYEYYQPVTQTLNKLSRHKPCPLKFHAIAYFSTRPKYTFTQVRTQCSYYFKKCQVFMPQPVFKQSTITRTNRS
jgi:hypothetical protein